MRAFCNWLTGRKLVTQDVELGDLGDNMLSPKDNASTSRYCLIGPKTAMALMAAAGVLGAAAGFAGGFFMPRKDIPTEECPYHNATGNATVYSEDYVSTFNSTSFLYNGTQTVVELGSGSCQTLLCILGFGANLVNNTVVQLVVDKFCGSSTRTGYGNMTTAECAIVESHRMVEDMKTVCLFRLTNNSLFRAQYGTTQSTDGGVIAITKNHNIAVQFTQG